MVQECDWWLESGFEVDYGKDVLFIIGFPGFFLVQRWKTVM